MGRRSPLPGLLAAIGAGAPAEESEDLGFVYYGRFFQTRPAGVCLLLAVISTTALPRAELAILLSVPWG
jgi:hypothetical protein